MDGGKDIWLQSRVKVFTMVQEVESQLKAEMLEWNCDQNLCKIMQNNAAPSDPTDAKL
jgi:hypothetical protein